MMLKKGVYMALYANENGTLQQLSDKSSGSNPYVQLELVYSRDFIADPLPFDSSIINIEHTILTNKPINEHYLLLAVCGESYTSSFPTLNLKYISIPSWYKYADNVSNPMSIGLENYCAIYWYLPSDKTSNVLKYKYYTSYPTGGYGVYSKIWDFYLI